MQHKGGVKAYCMKPSRNTSPQLGYKINFRQKIYKKKCITHCSHIRINRISQTNVTNS